MERFSSSQRSSLSGRQIRPRACLAMKLMASGVTFSAAMHRSPSFSRSASSTRTIMRPWRISSTASSTVANAGLFSDTSVTSQPKNLIEQSAEQRGTRDGHHPDDHQLAGYTPAHGGQAARGAYAHDRAGDGVRGAHGYSRLGRAEQHDRARGLRSEPAEGRKFGDALSHGADDAPASSQCPASHRRVTSDDYPKGYAVVPQQAAGDQRRGDDAHAFLRVVGAVADAVRRGGDQLQTAEPAVHTVGRLTPDHPTGDHGDQQAHEQAHKRREKKKEHRLGPASGDQRLHSDTGHGRAAVAAHQRVRGAGGNSQIQRQQIPQDRAYQAG